MRDAERKLRLTERIAPLLPDQRVKSNVIHRMLPMQRQRVYGLALGYEVIDDHFSLRSGPAIQTDVGRDEDLASSPTLCRFENWASPQRCWDISRVLLEIFIGSFSTPPAELMLDFDSTDDLVYGVLLGAVFHGYYDHQCFLLLYVLCGEKLLSTSAPGRCRQRPSCLGDLSAFDQALAAGMAAGSHHLERRHRKMVAMILVA